MRGLILSAMATAMALALATPQRAEAAPVIDFGRGIGAATPTDCAYNSSTGNLDCSVTSGTTLSFTVWIHFGSAGGQAWSFGATWDYGSLDQLTANSAAQTSITELKTGVDPGPPPVSLFTTWNISGTAPVVVQSTPSVSGSAKNWEAFANSGAGTSPYLAVAGLSFRAGYLDVTWVGNPTDKTRVQAGWFDPNSDAFGDYQANPITPIFKAANILPEPAAALSLLAGVATVALLVRRRSRRSL